LEDKLTSRFVGVYFHVRPDPPSELDLVFPRDEEMQHVRLKSGTQTPWGAYEEALSKNGFNPEGVFAHFAKEVHNA